MIQKTVHRSISKRSTDFLRRPLSLYAALALLLCSTLPLRAQTDYSGTYYIASNGYNAGTPANNYYLCPTEGWCYYAATNDFSADDTGMPFLTTHQCRDGVYDVNAKAVWNVVKHPTEDYYYIRRASDGKYVVLNGQIRTTSNANRMRVHLEALANPDDNALFALEPNGTAFNIKPKTLATYLTVNGGNNNSLVGVSGKGNGPTGYANTGGIIGIYPTLDGNSNFYLESAVSIDKPVITNNYDGTFTITAHAGATIYYTTDGSTPTTSTLDNGSSPINILQTANLSAIKAIAKHPDDNFPTAVTTYTLPVCKRPSITVDNSNNVTITCETPGASIYYTDNNTEATSSSTPYSGSFNMGGATIIRAIAIKSGYYKSAEGVLSPPLVVHSSSEIDNMYRYYILASDFTSTAAIGTEPNPFTGTIDGQMNVFRGLDHPLVAYADGATIKNVILDNVSISSGTNVGAICGEATGDSRIYNCGVLATGSTVEKDDGYDVITSCSSTIGGSGFVGSIVGLLDGSARVVNCFSYANITGGNLVGGIVGKNNVATTASNLKTMVMNCMYYGEITGGTEKAPVYNGQIITNDGDANGVNNFNYFRLESSYIRDVSITKVYNCALGAETRFLQRFEFFRHLLNSNRELAAWWATGDAGNVDEMMKWVLEPSQIGTSTPYPVLKTPGRYASVVNYTPSTIAYNEDHRNEGRKLTSEGDGGVLHVTIRMGDGAVFDRPFKGAANAATITTSSVDLTITDKDFEHFNFNYGKVQLPYYNDFGTQNYRDNRVVTGWKIVSITGGTAGSYTTGDDVTYTDGVLTATPYNFADRHCTNKDLYDSTETNGSDRVFNQGAYWDVPEGVTAITIEPYWAKAVYVADAYWDVTYLNSADNKDAMATAFNVTTVGGGQRYENGVSTFNGQLVYTSISAAIASSGSALFSGVDANSHTVYDYAVVLVGNYHQNSAPESSNSKPYTVTSVDLDGDNEPDYSFLFRFNSRTLFHPARYDFLNVIGLGMAQKTTGGTGSYNLGIMQPKGWFEVTNTALFRVTQFEYSPTSDLNYKKPIILQGGVIEQWVTQQQDAGDKVAYFHVGGNVWFKEFHRGSHQDNAEKSTPHPPLSVTGGDFDRFYLTGYYQSQAAIYDDNAECYINGGRFGEVAGAGMEGIGTSNGKGNITWIIDHADIREFYGGGINHAKPVKGNIHTIISNSHVELFCGGPKFGDMESGRTVTTTATNCTFGTYFGAGYGGNSYNRYAPKNKSNVTNIDWNAWVRTEYKQEYKSDYGGVSAKFDYQFIPMSGNLDNVARLFVEFVAFSLATTHDVTSSLTGCTITGNFYGGGSLGEVDGDIASTLDGCTVNGNVFGAGYSASLPPVEVDSIGFKVEPYYYTDLGTYRTAEKNRTTTYTWQQANAIGIDKTNHILKTTADLTALGTVTGEVSLTLKGNTTVGTLDGSNQLVEGTGNVYGGGEESKVQTNTTVAINGASEVRGSVFGAGKGKDTDTNMARVGGSSTVTLNGADARVLHNIYGGGELSMVNGNTQVNIVAGKVGATDNPASTDGFVFGGGKGTLTDPLFANVKGNTHVTMSGGTVHNTLFGGGELASVGTFTLAETADAVNDIVVGEPISCADGTGRCLVEISGGQIGHKDATLLHDIGYVFGAGMGVYTDPHAVGAGGLVYSAANARFGYVDSAEVQISDEAFIVGGVWGGSEDGQVLHNCGVKVSGGQIGCGYNWSTREGYAPYTSTQWTNAINAVKTQNDAAIISLAAQMPECMHWPYGAAVLDGEDNPVLDGEGNPVLHYLPYDPYASLYGATDASDKAGDGHTFFGNVFGGGSGYYAYLTDDGAGGYTAEWYKFQGRVRGNTYVEVTGGHILTSIYGGCEFADVMGSSSVVMTGGTLGVPRTLDSILDHPVTCYLFGAGKGDQRTRFSTSTNVHDVKVNVTGGVIFGSVFGGGEDGHVLGDAEVNIGSDAWVGTWGSSYVDGNIFGAGRGFGGERLTAGTVGGNVTVNVTGNPTMLGSVYGGGRLASVGTYFAEHGDPNYGELQPDVEDDPGTLEDESRTHGHVTVNISGGTIGNNRPYHYQPIEEGPLSEVLPTCPLTAFDVFNNHIFHTKGGNVFGGSMGRLTKLDGTLNEDWVDMALVKETHVNISGGIIRGNVYGGGEIGTVDEDTYVNITGGTIGTPVTNVVSPYAIEYHYGSVFGGGSGLLDHPNAAYVRGNTHVSMSAGQVLASVYGGGEMATVGTFEYNEGSEPKYLITGYTSGGNTTVEISGGIVGPSEELHMPQFYGHVFGAGKGLAYDTTRYTQVPYLNFVYSTDVTISGTALVKGSVYGGSENGHVYQNTDVKIQGGQIGCGAGHTTAYAESAFIDPRVTAVTVGNALAECPHWAYSAPYSTYDPYANSSGQYPDATDARGGRPTGTDGHTFYGNVFGGGSGVFPYLGRTALDATTHSEYVRSAGQVRGNTSVTISGGHILTSVYGGCELTDVLGDSCVVVMTAGTLGVPRTKAQMLAHPVTCYLFGAGKGDQRTFFNEWTNVQNTRVTVGGTAIVYGSIFGGGEDGHINGNSKVVVTGTPLIGTLGTSYVDGNIFGAGRGFGGDALTAGSVGGDIQVLIDGGHMMGSVYGGGRLASVGSYFVPVNNSNYGLLQPDVDDDPATDATDESESHGHITVSITGSAKVGNDAVSAEDKEHSGKVFGGSMGRITLLDGTTENPIWPRLAKAKSTDVTIGGNAEVQNNVYGGGEMGYVLEDTKVTVQGTATVRGNVYGGGYGSDNTTYATHDSSSLYANPSVHAGRVYGNTGVYILGGTVEQSVYGGAEMAPIGHTDLPAKGNTLVMIGNADGGNATIGGEVFGANNLAGTPRGNTTVHVYSTAHSGTNAFPTGIDALAAPYDELTTEDITINAATQTYALSAVYGGGNLAAHDPTAADGTTLVHIHYCDQNTIRNIYGGGNAADTKNNHIIIEGGRIENVFGGGNGYSATNNHDNPAAPNYNPGANVNGTARTEIHGGIIDNIFGGSNQKGTIVTTVLTTDAESNCELQLANNSYGGGSEADGSGGEIILGCGTKFENFYAGSRNADIVGDIHLVINGGEYKNVFGGSKGTAEDAADITGSVVVDVYGGHIENLFGGSDVNGNITGTITVNVDCDPLNTCEDERYIGTVYGGGKDASYTPTLPESISPEVNIKCGTVSGDVFGGGLGSTARCISNPKVLIGGDTGSKMVVVGGSVYGGGSAAPVTGGTTVGTRSSYPENRPTTINNSVYGGGLGATATVSTNTSVNINGSKTIINGSVYGGGNAGQVFGNTDVQVGAE